MPVLLSFKCAVCIISLWCQCLLKFTFFRTALWYYVQRLYFPTILLCLCIFYGIKNQFQRLHSYRGKTSQQCEVGNASCIREGSIKLACHPPYCQTWICPPQMCIPRCPLLTIWLVTFPSTISLYLWPTLHSWACTNLHPWWIPFDSPQWAEEHDGCVLHWSVTQCRNWATTSTAHRQTSYTQISKQEGWGPSRHFSWQPLGKRPEPCIFDIRVFSPFAQNHQNTFLSQCYKKNEQETKRVYDQHVREVERGVFQH